MEYDANNNLTRQIDAKGNVIAFKYDQLNRVTEKSVTAPGGTPERTYSTYDQAESGYFNKGRLTQLRNGIHTINYDYHELGGVEKEQHAFDNRSYTIQRQFHRNGALRNEKLPFDPGTTNTAWAGEHKYDRTGQPTGFGSHIIGTNYDLRLNPTVTTFSNGSRDTRTYDARRGWLTRTEFQIPNGTKYRTDYTRAASGRISKQNNLTTSYGRFNYTYDYAGRLLTSQNFGIASVQAPYSETFKYNPAGSITYKSHVGSYKYRAANGAHPHAPYQVGNTTLTYDANGNMLKGVYGKSMTYDAENRPSTVTKAGITTDYKYAADGSRLMRSETGGSNTVTFANVEIRNFKAAGEEILTYPHPNVRLHNGVAGYLSHDHLGSVLYMTDAAGNKTEHHSYRPFGEKRAYATSVAPPETKGWIGERYDAAANLQYLNARYYDPKLGLFLQPDWFEIMDPGVGTNRYAYSGNDPINKLDPGGNSWKAVKEFFGNMFEKKFDEAYDAARAEGRHRNADLAGKRHSETDVPFDSEGFPDYSDHLYKGVGKDGKPVKADVNIGRIIKKSRRSDKREANRLAGLDKVPDKYVWHHHQDSGRMQLVNQDIHSRTGHSGGHKFAEQAMNRLSKIMDSQTMKTLELVDPFTHMDNTYRSVYGVGLFERAFMTPAERWAATHCRAGNCS